MNGIQLLITAIALVLLTAPLLLLAFVAGRRSLGATTLPQFDRRPLEFVEVSGAWRVEFDGDEPTNIDVSQFELSQKGCRIVATGNSLDGRRHFLEGVLYERRFCCVCIEEDHHLTTVGTLTAELSQDHKSIIGMRTHWSSQSQALIVRKAHFTRIV